MNHPQRFNLSLLVSFLLLVLIGYSCKNEPPSSPHQERYLQIAPGETAIDSIIVKASAEANQFRDEGQYAKAIDLLKIVREHPDFQNAQSSSQAFLFQRISVMFFLRGDFYSSNEYLDTTISIRLLNNVSDTELAETYYIQSNIKSQLFLGSEALESIQKAISLVEKEASPSLLTKYFVQLADAFLVLKDFGQAKYYYQKCLDLNNGEENAQLAMINDKLGHFHRLQGQHDQQLARHEEALRISTNLGLEGSKNHFVYESNIGNYYLNRGSLDKAKESLDEVLKKLENAEVEYYNIQETTIMNLAMVEMLKGRPALAKPYYTKMLTLAKQVNPSPYSISKARAYEGLGDVEAGLNQFDEAIDQYHQAIKSLCIGFDSDDSYANPSLSDHLTINPSEVLRILGFKAEALAGKHKKSKDLKALKSVMGAYRYLDQLLVSMRQQFKAASSRYELVASSLAIYEKGTQTALQLYEITNDPQYLTLAFNLSTKNKAIVLQEGLQDEQAKFAGIPAKVLAQENVLKKERFLLEADIIEIENSDDKKGLKAKRNRRFEVIREYEKLIAQLEKDYPKYHELKHQNIDLIDPQEIIAQIPEATALLDFFVGQKNIYVFSLSKIGLRHYTLAKPKKLNALCTSFRTIFQNNETPPSGQEFSDIAFTLYQALLEKPLADLEPTNINRLIIIPDDYLLQISFDGLLTQPLNTGTDVVQWASSDIPYLLRQYAISYGYSNRLLFDKKAVKRVKKSLQEFVGFGLEYDDYTLAGISEIAKLEVDTTGGNRGMGKLRHSIEEVTKIKEIIGNGSLYTRTGATKDVFIQKAPSANILHLAMHGFETSDSPLNAGLIFTRKKGDADFMLKAADLYAMSIPAEMTVLSACNTATGVVQKGEGVRSLARAFKYAGCNSLVASLWSISDHTTKKIMIEFYTHLKNGDTKDVALQKAKLNYLQTASPSQSMPFYWTNLISIGDMQALNFDKKRGSWF